MGLMNNGVKQWVFQRISNALIITFGVCLLCVFLSKGINYASLSEMFASGVFKLYLAVVLVFSCVNAVLAAWQIDGDYASKFHIPSNLVTIVALIVSVIFLIVGFVVIF